MPKLTDRIDVTYGRETPGGFASRHGTEAMPSPETLVGLELEIEGWAYGTRFPGFRFENDGSLRNGGMEAITEPVRLMHAPGLLRSFFAAHALTAANYSERCSTHVHMNVLDFTFEQVATLSLLYQTLERLLFKFVGNDRDKNIFCVPWSQSGTNYRLVNELTLDPHGICRRWQKYTALNLQPITTQGTVEFRHLHGTNDMTVITNWLKLLGRMKEYAAVNTLDKVREVIMGMNTVSNYGQWLEDVFRQEAALLRGEGMEQQLSLGVVDTKFMLVQPEKVEARKKSLYDDFLARHTGGQQDGFPRGAEAGRQSYWSPLGEPRLNPGEEMVEVRSGLTLPQATDISRHLPINQMLIAGGNGTYTLREIRQIPGWVVPDPQPQAVLTQGWGDALFAQALFVGEQNGTTMPQAERPTWRPQAAQTLRRGVAEARDARAPARPTRPAPVAVHQRDEDDENEF